MVNPDIIGGLRSALTRGYSLEEAMLSFFNAGYKQKEIEEASQALQSQMTGASDWSPQPIWTLEEEEQVKHKTELEYPIKQKPVVIKEEFKAAQPKQVVTKGVAAYTNKNTSRITTITIVLVILLVVLLGILGLMYLFKDQIIDFFNSLF